MKLTRLAVTLLATLCLLLAACGNPTAENKPSPISLNVFAAASLTEAFTEISTSYQQEHPNIHITYNFNGSQILVQQMQNGANADLFASADQRNMQKASSAGLVNKPEVFARNKLVVILPAANPSNIQTLKDLARAKTKIVVAAQAVPVGKYTLQALDKLGKSPDYGTGYVEAVKKNIVSEEENVKAVVQKVQLGEADAGFVYSTDVTANVAQKLHTIDIPDNFNVIAEYPIAVTKTTQHSAEAQSFLDYILSDKGQSVLTKYRFLAPK
uniref:Molybdenum ABC transporter substrate-binding protein n=1 Tax=Thermosporothrix sp. COM3 TaxID=2490863 RepID=A0A455SQL7_9CHLR|nr:molybdenum ABC transporter substrate-binding protein [Thermosporothrix sp. COM3]